MTNLKITTIQSPLSWEKPEANRNYFEEKINRVVQESDLIILPEMFTTGFSMDAERLAEPMDGESVSWLKRMAQKASKTICGSLIIEDGGNYYNRLIWMRPDGSFETYDKRHLFRMADEHHYYTGGKERLIIELKGWRICPMICYDLRFPVWSRNNNEYDLLIYVANWPEVRQNAWSSLLIARAIENLSYVVGVNRIGEDGKQISYSGDTAIIDFKGNKISTTKAFEEKVETTELSMNELHDFREKFPAFMDADRFTID